MRSRIRAVLARPWWLLLLSLVAMAGTTPPAPPAVPPPYGQGLLFELEPPDGGPPSFLFGTIHSEDPRVLRLPEAVLTALEAADTLVLEVVPDAAALEAAAASMRLSDGTRLSELVTPELYRDCLAAAASRGLPEAVLEGLKPWAVMTVISTPQARTGEFLDRHLYNLAHARGTPTIGLETTAEQLSLFEQFTLAEQLALLRAAIAQQDDAGSMFDQLVDAYLRGALGELLALSEARLPGVDAALQQRFRDILIDARNRRMLHRILALPGSRRYFIAVGALHLPGRSGVLSGLQDSGYRIHRLH
jgi:uncharacterized protein YbaP (TraB family)